MNVWLSGRAPTKIGLYLTIDTWPPNYTDGNSFRATHSVMSSMKLLQRLLSHWLGNHQSTTSQQTAILHWQLLPCSSEELKLFTFQSVPACPHWFQNMGEDWVPSSRLQLCRRMGEVCKVSRRSNVSPGRGTLAGASGRGNQWRELGLPNSVPGQ